MRLGPLSFPCRHRILRSPKNGMIKHHFASYPESIISVNGSSQERPGSADFQGFAGSGEGGDSGKVGAWAWSGRSEGFLIYVELLVAHLLQSFLPEGSGGPAPLPRLHPASTFSSGFPRPRTIRCGLDHCFFPADIEFSISTII